MFDLLEAIAAMLTNQDYLPGWRVLGVEEDHPLIILLLSLRQA
ncbi:hypothetical protein [Corynebacterium comes]|uniref:Uncharacterized protein n=1 Tax=Corynebacterium comes TaxID=2675218 RepID=A0A6B8WEH0_9CORY|nr:hypothetical protein [Corynebacterium comes]QGU05098.1 hypothetical protein CETAM_09225 [Corynebacterium comes]